ncbi:hypothetical protein [Streptomyces sp. NPDC003032]
MMDVTGLSVPASAAEAVRALVAGGETAWSRSADGPEAQGGSLLTLALAGLLSTNPKKEEPIEDAFGGIVQDLTYTAIC